MKKLMGPFLVIFIILSFIFIISPSAQEKKDQEGIYTVKKGDTLWDISAHFLKDPFLWPKLWQRNPYITNPHWIYPGNPVRLSPLEEVKEEPPKVIVEEKPKEVVKEPEIKETKEVPKVEPPPIEKKQEVVAEVKPAPVKKEPSFFHEVRSAGFLSDIDYRGIGTILESKEGKNLMSKGDVVYMAFKTSEPILIGNKYTVFRASEVIRHPVTDKKVGIKYNITGNVQVIDQYGNFFTAMVIESFDHILKGDMIQPYFKEKMEGEEGK